MTNLKDLAVSAVKSAALLPLYDFFGGLSEFWVVIFGGFGIYLAIRGKLDGNYAGMIGALTTLLVAHDGLDDFHVRKLREQDGKTDRVNRTEIQ
jgi:hypothetical protein